MQLIPGDSKDDVQIVKQLKHRVSDPRQGSYYHRCHGEEKHRAACVHGTEKEKFAKIWHVFVIRRW
jgi:hypothetical protein